MKKGQQFKINSEEELINAYNHFKDDWSGLQLDESLKAFRGYEEFRYIQKENLYGRIRLASVFSPFETIPNPLKTTKSKGCPEYYIGKYKGIEAMDVVLDFQRTNYNLGTALTYLMRAGKKPNNPMAQDIQKAIDHLKAELNSLKKNA